jgi:hypothetical protein
VTPVLEVPVTLAANCIVCDLDRLTEVGLMVNDAAGTRVIIAVADTVELVKLVAVTMTCCVALMLDGAVYKPVAESVPVLGFMLQVTLVWVAAAPFTTNCCVCDLDRLTAAGLMVTDAVGIRAILALADLAPLVAVIVTVWVALILDGAV